LLKNLSIEHKILMYFSERLIETCVAQYMLLRLGKFNSITQDELTELKTDMARTSIYDAAERIHRASRNAINSFSEGDENRKNLLGLTRFTKVADRNTVASRRKIAEKMIAENSYAY